MRFKFKIPVSKKKHKYIRELLPSLPFPYDESNYHDLDVRDTFNMDLTIVMWMYQCLRYFQDKVTENVVMDDPTWQTFEVDGEKLTQLQCINRMVEDCKIILLGDEFEEHEEMDAAMRDLFKVFSEVYWAMWW